MERRGFLRYALGSVPLLSACAQNTGDTSSPAPVPMPTPFTPLARSPIYRVQNIPDQPFTSSNPNRHAGVDALLDLMARSGLPLYRSSSSGSLAGPYGLIAANDVVLIKVNAQWKYRGCTNSDVVRGLIQRLLEHPDGFTGEIVIVENGQGRGSLDCNTSSSYGGDTSVHANANDERHTFLYLVNQVFRDARVSAYLFDPIRGRFISDSDHTTDGYRKFENVSYPCFTTAGGRRVELREGVWNGSQYESRLKLINVPVLKHHDTGGSEITGAVKLFYGLLSMSDGNGTRHYSGLGDSCGRMIVSVRTPVISITDAIWVSHKAIGGYPESQTRRLNQLLASQDPIALDYYAAKYVLYPIDNNPRHAPDFAGIDAWMTQARDLINARGGVASAENGIRVRYVTKSEAEMEVTTASAA